MDAVQPDLRHFRLPQQNGSVRAGDGGSDWRPGPGAATLPRQETEEQTALPAARLSDAMGR